MKTDIDGFPTLCIVCSKPIVKSRHDSQRNFDHSTNTATSWHTECSTNTHPFYCRGKRAFVTLVMGSWFCSVCGGKVDWVIT